MESLRFAVPRAFRQERRVVFRQSLNQCAGGFHNRKCAAKGQQLRYPATAGSIRHQDQFARSRQHLLVKLGRSLVAGVGLCDGASLQAASLGWPWRSAWRLLF